MIESLLPYRSDFPEAVAALDAWQRDAATRRARLTLAQMPLSIGVMGQIKAGKSSFLNQLLFEGQPVLPEAATPKTANLTRIRYQEQPTFVAHCYSPQAWAALERLAASNLDDPSADAARELVTAARRTHGDGIAAQLAQGTFTLHARDVGELLGRIDDYVGADGRFAALVESSELALPLPELEGIEIVDTPGLNDPVVSRTDKTRQYMAQCDVVFFFSRASSLLDESDQQLLATQLPAKGVKRLILVATQFDAAILDDGFDRQSLHECENRLRERLSAHAGRILTQLAAQRERQGFPEVAALLREIGAPIFASTFAHAFAVLPQAQWSDKHRYIHQQFLELAEDAWAGQYPTPADWERIGGFAALTQALAQARADKEAILAAQRASTEAELTRNLQHLLSNLRDQANDRLTFLKTHELADLDAHAQKTRKRLKAIADTLSGFVLERANTARAEARRMRNAAREGAIRARTLEERTGYETHWHSVKVSDSVWYKPWTWGDYHYESYSTTTTYRYLAVSDAIEQLRSYFDTMRTELLRFFDRLIAPDTLSAGLRRELLSVLDTRSEAFDPLGLRALVESTLARLAWPKLELAAPDPSSALSGFAAEVRNSSETAALRERVTQVAQELEETLVMNLDHAVQAACTQLDALANELQSALSQSLTADLDRLAAAMADKNHQIARLEALLAEIDRIRRELSSRAE